MNMYKTELNEDHRKLIDLLSLKETLDDVKRIFAVGERAVGTPGELEACKIIESRFKEIGLKNVHMEPFGVMTDFSTLVEVELLTPIHKKIACGRCFGTEYKEFATGSEGYTGLMVNVGFGTLKDFNRLKSQGVDFSGKIVLIEVNASFRSPAGSWAPVLQAQEFGASAAILTSVIFERDILRNYKIRKASIPVVSIPYIEAQAIRRLLR